MQVATASIVSGPVLWDFFHPAASVTQRQIKIYCRAGDGPDIVRYIRNMTSMKLRAYCARPKPGRFDGVGQVWWMSSERLETRSEVLQIMESLSSSARDALMFSHSTFMFCMWDAEGLWHGYPELTLQSRSITSPRRVTHPYSIRPCLLPYTVAGGQFYSTLNRPHRCGIHRSCPTTLRRTSDDGCLSIKLPESRFCSANSEAVDTAWSMQGQGCTKGIINGTVLHRSAFFATGIGKTLPIRSSY